MKDLPRDDSFEHIERWLDSWGAKPPIGRVEIIPPESELIAAAVTQRNTIIHTLREERDNQRSYAKSALDAVARLEAALHNKAVYADDLLDTLAAYATEVEQAKSSRG